MTHAREPLDALFSPLTDRRSYLSALYLLLGLPLGTAYFAFLTAGLSTGASLSLVLIGIPILAAVMAAVWYLGGFERWLARKLLGVALAAPALPVPPQSTWRARIGALLLHKQTWKMLVYLVARLPMGIVGFTIVTVGLATSLSLLAMPLVYKLVPVTVVFWRVTDFSDAMFLMALGVLVAVLWLHVFRGLTALWSRFAAIMLRA